MEGRRDGGQSETEEVTDIEMDGVMRGWIDKQARDGGAPPS